MHLNCKMKNLSINEVIKNIKKSNKKYKTNDAIKINIKCLLCENYDLIDLTIKKKKFGKKGRYTIPFILVGNKGVNEYEITFPINYKKFKADIEYNVDYHLKIMCLYKD